MMTSHNTASIHETTAAVSSSSVGGRGKARKFLKKVTWSSELTAVKIITPDTNVRKLKPFVIVEEEELKQLNLL